MILISLDRTISFRFFFLFSMGLVFIPVVYLSFIFLFHFITVNRPGNTKNKPILLSYLWRLCHVAPAGEKKGEPNLFSSRFTTPLNTEVTFQKLFLGSLVCHWHLPQTFSRLPQKYQAILKHHTHTLALRLVLPEPSTFVAVSKKKTPGPRHNFIIFFLRKRWWWRRRVVVAQENNTIPSSQRATNDSHKKTSLLWTKPPFSYDDFFCEKVGSNKRKNNLNSKQLNFKILQ